MNCFSRLIFEFLSVHLSSVVGKRTGAASEQAVNSPSLGYPAFWLSHMHIRTHTCHLQTPPLSVSPSGPGWLLYIQSTDLWENWRVQMCSWSGFPGLYWVPTAWHTFFFYSLQPTVLPLCSLFWISVFSSPLFFFCAPGRTFGEAASTPILHTYILNYTPCKWPAPAQQESFYIISSIMCTVI